jgi:lipopolysaccharide assembly outer membrane protein LptD (OstA)
MSRKTRVMIGVGLLVLALGGGLAASLHFRRPAPAVAPGDQQTNPVVSIARPVIKHTEGDKLAWQIRLKEIQITHGTGLLSAQGIQEALIYNSSGAPMVRVTAEKVTGVAGGSDFSVTGKVNVVSYQGVVLNTDTVQWKQSQGKILAPGQVTARSREAMFSTTDLTYDLNQSTIAAPGTVSLYSGQNKIVGKTLTYNVSTGNFGIDSVQMIFNAEEAKRLMQEIRRP